MNLKAVNGKANEINDFCLSVGGSPDAVNDVAELGEGASICLEQGLFNVTKKAGAAGVHTNAFT